MSRWVDAGMTHPFRATWKVLIEAVDSQVIDDVTVLTTVEELARLKKIIVYVDTIISGLDLELTPLTIFNNFQQQAALCLAEVQNYQSNRNAAHLSNANGNADNLLSYIRPYMVVPEVALDAYGAAVKAYTDKVNSYIKSFEQSAKKSQSSISTAFGEIQSKKDNIEAIEIKIKKFSDYLFEGDGDYRAAEVYIKDLISSVESDKNSVEAFRKVLLDGSDSISNAINTHKNNIQEINDELGEMREASTKEHKELKSFHTTIFGKPAEDGSDKLTGGLKQELDDRIKDLDSFEKDQKVKHQAMHIQIESLLPGATSAGLASAYNKLKNSFDRPIFIYSVAFYISLSLMLIGGLVMVTDTFGFSPFAWTMVKAGDWSEMLRTILTRVPIIAPVIWLAIFSATRRSQYERLQQEYAHKESLASSYQSYKMQLIDLKVDGDQLQKELIAKSIDAIAYNASKSLDGNHTEKPPVLQLLEKLNLDEIKSLIELVRGKLKSN